MTMIEPYKIKTVEYIHKSTLHERKKWIQEADFNLFKLKSEHVYIDLLTDSGNGALSDKQWSEMMIGDESYAGSASYYKLKEIVSVVFGYEFVIPAHQGRGAENILFNALVNDGDIIPGNSQFLTTKAHIELRNAITLDCTIDEAFDIDTNHPFKGNVNIDKLEKAIKENEKNVPFILITITCNDTGGQPVSLQNLRDIYDVAKKYGKMVVCDAARFAENAFFIKEREPGNKKKTITEIVKEIFTYVDVLLMSNKKDGISNIGGIVCLNDISLYTKISSLCIMYEGYITYGGLAGRDLGVMAQGLLECVDYDYLKSRVQQVHYLGDKLMSYGIPLQKPFGGHAIYIDVKKFLPHLPKEDFRGQLLSVEAYIEGGVRGSAFISDRHPVTKVNRYPKVETFRLSVPRRTYTNNHMDYVCDIIKNVWNRRLNIKEGFEILHEDNIMRFFSIKLKRKCNNV